MIRPKTKITIKDGDRAWQKFRKEMKRIRGAYVSIGVHENAGQYEDGTSVVLVALWNEFGTRQDGKVHTPMRSFLRSTIDENQQLIDSWRREAIEKIAKGEFDTVKALEMLGFRIRELVRNKIRSNVPPANKPSTIAAKRREGINPPDHTLMETQLMLRSIEYKVHAA